LDLGFNRSACGRLEVSLCGQDVEQLGLCRSQQIDDQGEQILVLLFGGAQDTGAHRGSTDGGIDEGAGKQPWLRITSSAERGGEGGGESAESAAEIRSRCDNRGMKPNGRLSPQERMQRQRLRTVIALIAQKGCWRTMSITARCGRCGAWPAKVHIPTEIKGFYCGACCPIFTARARAVY
jgi:hypothetical protein